MEHIILLITCLSLGPAGVLGMVAGRIAHRRAERRAAQ